MKPKTACTPHPCTQLYAFWMTPFPSPQLRTDLMYGPEADFYLLLKHVTSKKIITVSCTSNCICLGNEFCQTQRMKFVTKGYKLTVFKPPTK